MKSVLKRILQFFALALVFPLAALCGFGRVERLYILFAHTFALIPGVVGDVLRASYYHLTLRDCSTDVVISFGSFFSRSEACVGSNVSIGAYCVIGTSKIGEWTQLASHVQIPSGRHQHVRDKDGSLTSQTRLTDVVIGEHCWIGASAIIMANVGAGSTIGAGSVVVKDIPAGVIAAGNPARVIRPAASP